VQAVEQAAAAVADRDAERAARQGLAAELAAVRARAEADRDRDRSDLAGLRDDLRAARAREEGADTELVGVREEVARLRQELDASRPAAAELRELISAALADRGGPR
jgi:predicted  nucleic acid-binding Zn-ribbon protein